MKTPVPIKPVAIPIAIGTNPVKQKVTQLLKQDKITLNDIEDLTNRERAYFGNTCTKILNKLAGSQREMFLAKLEQVMAPESKSDAWEINHLLISEAVAGFISQHGCMPTTSAIATQTGLCRQTVATHFAAYKRRPEFAQQTEQFKFMAPQVLANVLKFALTGDMRAARLYLEITGAKKPDAALTNTQNNYIQINNTILSQANLARLTTEQLNQIEYIIKG